MSQSRRVRCRFTATFEAELEIPPDATAEDVVDIVADVEIPESETARYLEDSFEPFIDECGDGYPLLFDEEGKELDYEALGIPLPPEE